MATQTAEVKCITRVDGDDLHQRITHVGGDGIHPWKLPLDQAINQIEKGRWSFYVEKPDGGHVPVVLAISADGIQYLTTEDDGNEADTLLNLPECPQ